MPRPKKIMPTSDYTETNRVYGLWTTDRHLFPDGTWLLDGNGNIIQSDFIGIVMAQVKRMGQEGRVAKVCIIGDDGNPIELKDAE
jgi:hypothetical protein